VADLSVNLLEHGRNLVASLIAGKASCFGAEAQGPDSGLFFGNSEIIPSLVNTRQNLNRRNNVLRI
jgi:hypothetical protein